MEENGKQSPPAVGVLPKDPEFYTGLFDADKATLMDAIKYIESWKHLYRLKAVDTFDNTSTVLNQMGAVQAGLKACLEASKDS